MTKEEVLKSIEEEPGLKGLSINVRFPSRESISFACALIRIQMRQTTIKENPDIIMDCEKALQDLTRQDAFQAAFNLR